MKAVKKAKKPAVTKITTKTLARGQGKRLTVKTTRSTLRVGEIVVAPAKSAKSKRYFCVITAAGNSEPLYVSEIFDSIAAVKKNIAAVSKVFGGYMPQVRLLGKGITEAFSTKPKAKK